MPYRCLRAAEVCGQQTNAQGRENDDRCNGFGQLRAAVVGGTILAMLAMSASALAQTYHQAPMLDALVESGALPPVEQRLPAEPLVVEPVESVGQYGGTWRSGLRGGLDNAWVLRTVAYDGLVRYDREWKKIIPNLAKSWEVSDDGRVYTFKLREGLKWNNGTPFTSADIAFAAELVQDPGYAAGSSWRTRRTR